MWRLKTIYAENICAFHSLHYELQQGKTTLIFGINRDDDNQGSNGSGKSAVIECISVGLTGNPLRKIKGEEIINDQADECFVRLQFTNSCNKELFTIERRLSRKGSASAACFIERNGEKVQTDEAVLPSIDAYNKYIMDKIGISKDELYNNFLLSKFKFQDFLSASDREKKEIINRFSNAIQVDQAIEKLVEDKLPVQEEVREVELEIAGLEGRIEMLAEQITKEEENQEEKNRGKREKINSLKQIILDKHSVIRQKNEAIQSLQENLGKLEQADNSIQDLEHEVERDNYSLEFYLNRIKGILSPLSITITDWERIIKDKHIEIKSLELEQTKWDKALENKLKEVNTLTSRHKLLKTECQEFFIAYDQRIKSYNQRLNHINEQTNLVTQKVEEAKQKRRMLANEIEALHTRLSGTLICPKCHHEYIISNENFDVPRGIKQLDEKKGDFEKLTSEITIIENQLIDFEREESQTRINKRALSSEYNDWNERIKDIIREIHVVTGEVDNIRTNIRIIKDSISSITTSLHGICRQTFDEAFDLIDSTYREKERGITALQGEIKLAEGSIASVKEAIYELNEVASSELVDSLKDSLAVFRVKLHEAITKKINVEKQLLQLDTQEELFTQFKTYLANTKIDALALTTNEFLKNIGSDIRVKFSGYTVLKTGKIREKISITLTRDGIDRGSLGKFSAGEITRVNLATILAMQKLINSNCKLNRGLDLLVLDEILEAIDEAGLASVFSALNQIGTTCLVVSHGNIAEAYPYKLLVCKENNISKIVQ